MIIRSYTLLLLLCLFSTSLFAAEKAPQKVVDLGDELATFGTDPVIIEAVKAQNSLNKTLTEVKKRDDEWINTPGVTPEMQRLIDSKCGKHLVTILESKEYYEEIFVMDSLGANVAMTDKTSDYWQGDEAKFKNSYKGGAGAIFVDDVEFDDSAQSYLVQISVPVKDGDTVIGAITFGINVDKITE